MTEPETVQKVVDFHGQMCVPAWPWGSGPDMLRGAGRLRTGHPHRRLVGTG